MKQKYNELFAIMVTTELRSKIEYEAKRRGLRASSFARSILYQKMFPEVEGVITI